MKKWVDKVTKERKQDVKEYGKENCRLWICRLPVEEWRISEWPQAWDHSQLELIMWPTEISQTWSSDDGFAVDFVTHLLIGWAINWLSMGVARRLTSENEWGVRGRERWAPFPSSGLLSHLQPWMLPWHYSSVPWPGTNQFYVLWATSGNCMISSRENCFNVKNKNAKSHLAITKS